MRVRSSLRLDHISEVSGMHPWEYNCAQEWPLLLARDSARMKSNLHSVPVEWERCIEPSNVMLTKTGAKLMDFGLAKQSGPAPLEAAFTEMTAQQSKLTIQGMIVGTLQYMAPEQLEGKETDARTDIFALGELIYEMATGKPAFAGKSQASLIAAILSSEPTPMVALQP